MAVATRTLQNFIGGEWIEASSDRTVADVNPADPSDVLAQIPLSSAEDARAAITAAADAFPDWRSMSPVRRGEVLIRASRILEERQEEIAQLITREQGKTLAESRAEVPRAIRFWGWMGYGGSTLGGMTGPTEADRILGLTLREPLGVVSLITPWNFPVNIPGWKLASALVCGNTVVLKPAQLTPLCAVALVEALVDAGIPSGVVNLLLGSGSELGDVLVTDERVKAISFTGSTATGLGINTRAAPFGKKVQAEMGGHNAVVVLEDADLDRAAEGSVMAAFGTTGQRCTAPRRIIAVKEIASELTERLREATRRVRVGPGNGNGSAFEIGPMVDEGSLEQVLRQIQKAQDEGAVLLEGGRRVGNGGYFLEPTLLAEVDRGMTIAHEEVFGPVLPVLEVSDYEEALDVAVSTRYGLSSAIYTRDLQRAVRFMHETDTGIVHVNKPPIGAEAHMPYGGLKDSTLGSKELGAAAEFFTQTKTVYLDYS